MREPGMNLPVPGKNDLRPRGANPDLWKTGPREVLKYCQDTSQVMDIGSPRPEWPYGSAMSPASARYTPGLRKSNTEAPVDPQPMTLQGGVKRH